MRARIARWNWRTIAMTVLGFVLLVVLILIIRNGATQANANANTNVAGTTGSLIPLQPGENPGVNAQAQTQTWLGHGTIVNIPKSQWQSWKSGSGYLIPRSQLESWAGNNALLFEGEQQKPGVHDVMLVRYADSTWATFVGDNGIALRNQGSFWTFEVQNATSAPDGFVGTDDLLMAFARDKRKNWETQGMAGNPIKVWLSNGPKVYQPGEAITLTAAQTTIVNNNDAQRCPAGSQPLEENPFGVHDSGPGMISAIGSFTCDTILVRGDSAVWFRGAKDGVPYTDADKTRIFLVPQGWGETEMATWVKNNFGLTLGRWNGQ